MPAPAFLLLQRRRRHARHALRQLESRVHGAADVRARSGVWAEPFVALAAAQDHQPAHQWVRVRAYHFELLLRLDEFTTPISSTQRSSPRRSSRRPSRTSCLCRSRTRSPSTRRWRRCTKRGRADVWNHSARSSAKGGIYVINSYFRFTWVVCDTAFGAKEKKSRPENPA